MMAENLNFETTATGASVTELREKFPNLPPRILVTLAVMLLLSRSVSPFRICGCGCGASVHGKARLASPACRQRVSRAIRAIRGEAAKQFNLVLQHELTVTIPRSPAPRFHGCKNSAPVALAGICDACGRHSDDLKTVDCAPVFGAAICPACVRLPDTFDLFTPS